MYLSMIWPDKHYRFELEESHTSEARVGFNIVKGEFSSQHLEQQEENVVYFYWTPAGAVAFNFSDDYVCLIDGVTVEKGETRTLNLGSEIQIGHYNILAVMSESTLSPEDMFYELNGCEKERSNILIPEVEDILPSGAHYIGDLNFSNDISKNKSSENDVIKPLENEYKEFLIWGHINNNLYNKGEKKPHHIINDEGFFDAARTGMQSRTIMECILDSPSLIDKVWDELEVVNLQDDVLYEEEKYEILMLLAPEKFTTKEKKVIPELAFQDLYKIGLDSHY